MSGDIVERLRRISGGSSVVDLARDAAAEIERLRKRLQACQSNDDYALTDDCITQNERFLLDEVKRLRAERDASRLMISDLTAEVERLRAEVDLKGYRLDDALTEIERLRVAAVTAWREARRG